MQIILEPNCEADFDFDAAMLFVYLLNEDNEPIFQRIMDAEIVRAAELYLSESNQKILRVTFDDYEVVDYTYVGPDTPPRKWQHIPD